MTDFEDLEPLLSANTRSYVGTTAFADDRLDRKALAEKLTGYLERLNDGAVLAIDAPWGEGKTWFGRNWNKYLNDEGYKTIYIDAFEQDYIEDPFMLLASELLAVVEEKSKAKTQLAKKSVDVLKATMSIGTKIGAGLATKYLLGDVELGEEVEKAISDASGETALLTSKLIEENFAQYEENKHTIDAYKNELTKYASTQKKPLVIFIDELDRCKPDFAVNIIERIKHFFDVPNIVFVLLLNRDQLEKAVKGVYGSETDAGAYLGKFVHFFFALPKPNQSGDNSELILKQFIESTMKKYKFSIETENDSFVSYMRFWAHRFNLSLRDIEKAVALYSFAYPAGPLSYILTYLIVLKLKQPTLFSKLLIGDIEAHKKAKLTIEKFLEDENIQERPKDQYILSYYLEWHEAYINGFTKLGEHFGAELQGAWAVDKRNLFKMLAKKIELDIER